MRKILSIFLLLALSAHAQNNESSQPCMIAEYKGTCFYKNGEIAYWIVRPWRPIELGGGPEYALDETIGYPSALKVQQDYNRWIKTVKHFGSRLVIDVPAPVSYDERQWSEESELIDKRTQAAMQGRYDPALWSAPIRIKIPVAHGWERTGPYGYPVLTIPHHIAENGALNPDTLRIALFMTGARISASLDRLDNDCAYLSAIAFPPGREEPDARWSNNQLREAGVCKIDSAPKNETFAEMQTLLKARKERLGEAFKLSSQYDDAVKQIELIQGGHTAIALEKLPGSFGGQVAVLSAQMEEELRQAAQFEAQYQVFAAAYKKSAERRDAELVREWRKRDREAAEEYDKEYFAKFGVHLPLPPQDDRH